MIKKAKDPKAVPELGVGKDGYKTGGVIIQTLQQYIARKEKEGQERLDLDRMRAMMNQQNQDEKLDQNEELANLRAETSLEKQEIANEARERLAIMKPRGN